MKFVKTDVFDADRGRLWQGGGGRGNRVGGAGRIMSPGRTLPVG